MYQVGVNKGITKCLITHYIFNHISSQSNVHCLMVAYQNVRIIRCSLPSKSMCSHSRLFVTCYQRLHRLSDLLEIRYSNSSQKVVMQARVLWESPQQLQDSIQGCTWISTLISHASWPISVTFSIDLCTVPFSNCEICDSLPYFLQFSSDLNTIRYRRPQKCTEWFWVLWSPV